MILFHSQIGMLYVYNDSFVSTKNDCLQVFISCCHPCSMFLGKRA